jgi:hypothetical protein
VQDGGRRALYNSWLTEIGYIRGSADRAADLRACTRTVRVVSRRHAAIDGLPPMAAAQTPAAIAGAVGGEQ